MRKLYHWASPGQKCSVPGCSRKAIYTVALVDYYPPGSFIDDPAGDFWFFEQDYTCPFLCEEHRSVNELCKLDGGEYPYTNKHMAKGWSEYLPVEAAMRRPKSGGGGGGIGT